MPVGRTNRRAFIAVLGGAAAWPLFSAMPAAAQPKTIARVGVLTPGDSDRRSESDFKNWAISREDRSFSIFALPRVTMTRCRVSLQNW
jgi:hypothetical protein